MKVVSLVATLILCLSLVYSSPSRSKELDLSKMPTVRKDHASPRSVNLSFFVPAFSLFALASQYMPQMFPALTATTSSRHTRSADLTKAPSPPQNLHTDKPHWFDTFISNGIIY